MRYPKSRYEGSDRRGDNEEKQRAMIEPCRSSLVIFTFGHRHPSTATNCLRSEWSHSRTTSSSSKNYLESLRRLRWSSVSNATLMCRNSITDGVYCLRQAGKRSLTILVMSVSVEWSARYANCICAMFSELSMWRRFRFLLDVREFFLSYLHSWFTSN